MTDDTRERFERALLRLNATEARAIFARVREELSPVEASELLITPTLERIGAGWEAGSVSLSQVYVTGRICESLVESAVSARGDGEGGARIGLATLEDHHVLGRRIVAAALRSASVGFVDYGRAVVDELVAKVRADGVALLLVSVLMLPSALRVSALTDALAGDGVTVFVGGAPFLFDSQLYRRVGADGMGRTASDAIRLVREWEAAR